MRANDESVTVRRLGGAAVELFRVSSLREPFGKHTHEGLSIGAVDGGVGEFWCRGATHRVPRDHLVLIDPGEVHTGGSARGLSVAYRMAYVPEDVVSTFVPGGWRSFVSPAVFSPRLAAVARSFHAAVTENRSSLECESLLCDLLVGTATEFGDPARRATPPTRVSGGRMAAVREYLHAHATDDVSLGDLATLVQLAPSYVSRRFRVLYGLPPHAYQVQLRLRMAKARLVAGDSISAIAIALGFVDQAHFTTTFRRSFGITPGRYRRAVRGELSIAGVG